MIGLDNPLHIAIVLVVVLMVFGAKRLPEMGKSMGEGLRGFKSAISGDSEATSRAQAAIAAAQPSAPAAPTTAQPRDTEPARSQV